MQLSPFLLRNVYLHPLDTALRKALDLEPAALRVDPGPLPHH